MEIIVHHANWRGATGCKAFGEFDGKTSAGGNADGVVMGIGV